MVAVQARGRAVTDMVGDRNDYGQSEREVQSPAARRGEMGEGDSRAAGWRGARIKTGGALPGSWPRQGKTRDSGVSDWVKILKVGDFDTDGKGSLQAGGGGSKRARGRLRGLPPRAWESLLRQGLSELWTDSVRAGELSRDGQAEHPECGLVRKLGTAREGSVRGRLGSGAEHSPGRRQQQERGPALVEAAAGRKFAIPKAGAGPGAEQLAAAAPRPEAPAPPSGGCRAGAAELHGAGGRAPGRARAPAAAAASSPRRPPLPAPSTARAARRLLFAGGGRSPRL